LFRPILLIESACAVGGTIEAVLPAAAGAEGAHVASLVHDDIIDGDLLRRGRPATHAAFGVDDALVGGDALIFYLFMSLARCAKNIESDRIVEAMAVAATAGIHLCQGQLLEAHITATYDHRLSRYLDMIEGKTAALFRAACQIGAVLGGGAEHHSQALGRYGTMLGLAFQAHDDLLPYLSDPEVTGKPATSDLINRRLTLPILLCRADADAALAAELDGLLTGHDEVDRRFARLRTILNDSGALQRASAMAQTYAEEALATLRVLEPSPSKDSLEFFARSVADRRR
jgi:geranylgeranyl diphosphate synthase type I